MGRVSQKAGKEAEDLVEAAFKWYSLHGFVGWWSHPGPRMLFYGPKRGRARAIGAAPPDFVFFLGKNNDHALRGVGGLLEVKRTLDEEEVTLRDHKTHKEIDQFRQLKRAHGGMGRHSLMGYLVLWRGFWEWCYYPIQGVELETVAPPTVVLRRVRGWAIRDLKEAGSHVPDFLEKSSFL